MADPTEAVSGLIERIEAAGGPDREIDCRIWCELHGPAFDIAVSVVPDLGQWQAPHYTASIDAAMTLVDPRALWAHGSMEEGPFARLCWPQPDGTFTGGYHEANCATVPLSICATALKAKAMEARQGGNGEAGAVHDSAVPQGFAHPTGSIKGGDRG